MRKDVRTGAVIGGLLIAVLIVYGIVASRSHVKPGNQPVAIGTDKNPADGTTGQDGVPTTPEATPTPPAAEPTPAGTSTPVPPTPSASGPGSAAPSTPDAAGGTKAATNWATLLSAEHVESLMVPAKSETPDPSKNRADGHGNTDLPLAGDPFLPSEPRHTASGSGDSTTPIRSTPPSDNTPSAPAASSSYTVKSGDTLSSIARAAYGDARLYKKILEANPKINPNRMRAGITITLPGRSQFSHESAITDAHATPTTPARTPAKTLAAVDSATEYRVMSNDNLYRISMKLYNTPNKVDLIYQFNKTLIGPDPAKLKLNMVLKLPEPPTQSASTR